MPDDTTLSQDSSRTPGYRLPQQPVEVPPFLLAAHQDASTIGVRPEPDKQRTIAGFTEERAAARGGS